MKWAGHDDPAKIHAYPPPLYGTFQHPSPPPIIPALSHQNYSNQSNPQHYHAIPVGYQYNPYPALVEGVPAREPPLPCCGFGFGWTLFVSGFFLAAVPWYVGAFVLLCVAVDYREKAGLIACIVAAVLSAITVILGTSKEYLF